MTNLTYGLTLSDKGNPVLFIKYTNTEGITKQRYGMDAIGYAIHKNKKGLLDDSTLFNLKSLKKTTDEAFISSHQ